MKKKMMKLTAIIAAALLFCGGGVLAMSGCSCNSLNDAALSAPKIGDFTKTEADRAEFETSNGWDNGEPFNTYWKTDNVSFADKKASLSISAMAAPPANAQVAKYYGSEIRSKHYYGYGDFQVRMKPSKVVGTASTFFVCTGPYDQWYDEDGNVTKINGHDEIDIEFLGKDTTKVQFNYFADDVGGHEYMYDLGFDAAEEFHNYGFRWTENDITWFVDEKPVYKVTKSSIKAGESWPDEPGRVMMNYWSGTEKASAWMGKFTEDFGGRAEYEWAETSASPCPDPSSTKPGNKPIEQEPIPDGIAWDADTVLPFGSTDIYTVATDDTAKTHTVTYTAATTNRYTNIAALTEAPGRNYLGVTLSSKTDKPIVARVNLMNDTADQLAEKAYVSDGTVQIEGGATLTVPANGSVDLVVYYKGAVAKIEVMIDSIWAATDVVSANTLEISRMKFGVKGEVIIPEDKNPGVKIGESVVKFSSTTKNYAIESAADNTSMTVKYADVQGDSYQYIGTPVDITAIIGNHNKFNFKVKNNGEASATIRVDINCNEGQGTPYTKGGTVELRNNFCNVSADANGTIDMGNGYDWQGGDWFKIGAGATATISVTFTTGVGAKSVAIFIDSSTYQDTVKHKGELVFTEMNFAGTAPEVPVEPEVPDQPEVPAEGVDVLGAVTFASVAWDDFRPYTVTQTAAAMSASYVDLAGNCYATLSADVSSIIADNNALTFKVKNNGEANAKVCVTVECNEGEGTPYTKGGTVKLKNNFCNTSAVVTGAVESGNLYDWQGADWLTVAPGATATVTVRFTTGVGAKKITFNLDSSTFDDTATHSGNLEFTEMKLFTAAA